MILALTLGVSALNTLAQEDDNAPRRRGDARAGSARHFDDEDRVERPQARAQRDDEARSERPRARVQRDDGDRVDRRDPAPARRQMREEAPARRGMGYGGPPREGDGRRQGPAVCPYCKRSLGDGAFQGRLGRGQGFGPRAFRETGRPPAARDGVGPMGRGQGGPGFGRGARGPAFDDDRRAPAPPRDGTGPQRRGWAGPESRVERDAGSEGRGPARGPMPEPNDR